jgi:hypothetical protein
MSKPILVMRFPRIMGLANIEQSRQGMLNSPIIQDYHVLFLVDEFEFTEGNIKIECFNAPHTEIEFNELQSKILALMQQDK